MRRTLILTALGATTLSIGLGVGAALATGDRVPPHPTVTATMMGSVGMNGMDADDMNAMHTSMHSAMSERMSADQLAACDSAHAAMTSGQSPSGMANFGVDHTAHHQGTQP